MVDESDPVREAFETAYKELCSADGCTANLTRDEAGEYRMFGPRDGFHWWKSAYTHLAAQEPVAWLRNERGEFEGPATLAPLLLLGSQSPEARHGATYSPLHIIPKV